VKPLIAAVTILAIAWASYEAWELHHANESVAALSLERDRQAKLIETQQSRIKSLQAGSPAIGKASDKAAVVPRGQIRFGPANNEALLQDPTYRKLQAVVIRGKIDTRYASLFQELRLSPDKLAKLEDLLVERQLATTDAADAASKQELQVPMIGQALQNAAASVDDEIKAALGDSAYAQYQEFQQTPSEREIVDEVRTSLSYTSTPLTEEQSSQLIEALKQAEPTDGTANRSTGIAFAPDGTVTPTTPHYTITDGALELAQRVLGPTQLQVLQQIKEQQQAQRQITALSGPVRIRVGTSH
jgi:hypothetical protein